MTYEQALEVVKEAAHWRGYHLMAGMECEGPDAENIREALAVLDQTPPDGVPEFVYIGRSIAKDLGKKYVVVTTNIGTSAKLDAIKYRFDGVVSPKKDGEGK